MVAMKPNRTRVRECALVNDQKIVFSFHLFVRTSPSLLFLLFLSFPCLNHFVFLTISHPNKPFVADASAALSSDTASRSISVSMTSSHVSKSPNCFAASPSRANKLDHCSTCIASAHTHTHTHIRIPKQEPRPIRLPSRALFYSIHHSFHSIALTIPIPSPSLSEQHQKYKYKEASLTSTQDDIHIHIYTHTHTHARAFSVLHQLFSSTFLSITHAPVCSFPPPLF